jgi:hypothetical protein
MGAEIFGVAFNQSRHFNRDRIAGSGSFSAAMISVSPKPVNCGAGVMMVGIVISLPFSETGASRVLKRNGSSLSRLCRLSIPLAP